MHHAEEYFVDRVFACAARAPGDLAITGVGGSLTYQQLTDHIEEVALFLRDRGVLPGDRVGVRMPRSVEAIVTMLALFRAGACYVPLAHDVENGARLTALDQHLPGAERELGAHRLQLAQIVLVHAAEYRTT